MSVETYEGVLEKGTIRLKPGVKLPDHAKVYVIVTDIADDVKVSDKKSIRISTPRLARREDAARLKMQVVEERATSVSRN
ncbi:MAG: hypothetical protein ACOYYU_10150 [Chloroflexota bacterium]